MEWVDIKKTKPKHGEKVFITDGNVIVSAKVDAESFDYIWWEPYGFDGFEWDWDFEHKEITHWAELPDINFDS